MMKEIKGLTMEDAIADLDSKGYGMYVDCVLRSKNAKGRESEGLTKEELRNLIKQDHLDSVPTSITALTSDGIMYCMKMCVATEAHINKAIEWLYCKFCSLGFVTAVLADRPMNLADVR